MCPRDATPLGAEPTREDPLLGCVLGATYRITRVLGRGGMGRLYEAEHARLGRRFAVKVLSESHADKADAVRRFEREARALARIRSDFVLDVSDVLRTPDGRLAIVTQLLEGEDLQRRLDRCERLPVAEAIAIARQICRGLSAAHAVGIVHRDLKPSNLFLCATTDAQLAVRILDFGVAKLADDDDVTRTGVVLGTPAYMAPEQARGSANATVQSDVYAVGAVLYRMLTGRMPFDGEDAAATLTALLRSGPKRPRAIVREIPPALELLVQRAMSRAPEERPRSALELESALSALVPGGVGRDGGPSELGREASAESTLVLSRGAVAHAAALETRARRARPLAALVGLAVAASIAAATTIAVGALTTLGLDVGASLESAALGHALTIVGAMGGVALGVWLAWAMLARRWPSAAELDHRRAVLGRGLAGALGVIGAAALGALAWAALAEPSAPMATPASALVTLMAATLVGLAAARSPAS